MENPIIVPFDLNTARKIKSGEIECHQEKMVCI